MLTRAREKRGDDDATSKTLLEFKDHLTPPIASVIRARTSLLNRDDETARQHAVDAINSLGDDEDSFNVYYLAQLCFQLRMYSEATRLFKTAGRDSPYFEVAETVAHCAWKADELKFLLDYCEAYRVAGHFSYGMLESEISCYEKLNEHDEALTLIQSFIDNENRSSEEDERFKRYLRLRKSMIAKIIDRPDFICFDSSLLPALADVRGSNRSIEPIVATSQLLADGPNGIEGLALGYRIVREYFSDPKAHGSLMYLAGPEAKVEIPKHDAVQLDSAVAYCEKGADAVKWVVIESDGDVDSTRSETSADSDLARELMGKKVGDEFFLRRSIQDRIAVIKEVRHKFLFRAYDSMQRWEELFPGNRAVQSFNFSKSDGELDPEEMLRTLQQLDEPILEAESLYRNESLSVGMFASLVGRSTIDSLFYLASKRDTPIRCARGLPQEYEQAVQSSRKASEIVIDVSALATLYAIEAADWLSLPDGRFKVTFATLQEFKLMIGDPGFRFNRRRTLGASDGKMFLHERSEEDHRSDVERMKAFVAWVENNCDTIGGRGQLEIEPEPRAKIEKIFGSTTLEAIGAVVASDSVLWSDDFAISSVMEDFTPIDRCWTGAMLDLLAESEVISGRDRNTATLKLIAYGYRFIRMDAESLLFAAKESRWDAEDFSLVTSIDWLHTSGVNHVGALRAAAFLLEEAWRVAPLAELRTKVTTEVAKSIGQRNDGAQMLKSLMRVLQASGMNESGLAECERIINSRLDIVEGRRRVIFPMDREFRSTDG